MNLLSSLLRTRSFHDRGLRPLLRPLARTAALAPRLRLAGLAAALALAAPGSAQVVLSGSISDSTSGPLLGGVVYHALGSVTIPAGETLTVQPDAIVKFATTARLLVRGTILAGGAGPQVIFTSLEDDAAGGDTPADGPTIGAPGQWRGLALFSTATSCRFENVLVRYSGQGGFPGLSGSTTPFELLGSTITQCAFDGLHLNNAQTGATISGCAFTDNGAFGVAGAALSDVPGFTSNVASGNGTSNLIEVSNLAQPSDLVLTTANLIEGALLMKGGHTIPAGTTLTLGPGVVLKYDNPAAQVLVRGTLLANGTPAEPVVLTSFADDAFAGDSNLDGPSNGSPGDWRGLTQFASSPGSLLEEVRIRHAGQGGFSALSVGAQGLELRDTTIERCAASALDLANQDTVALLVQGCTFRDNGGYAVTGLSIMDVPAFASNQASGNGLANAMRVTATAMTGDLVVGPENLIDGALIVTGGLTVPAGLRLELRAGTVLKWTVSTAQLLLRGRLDALGTPAAHVVLTTIADDSIAGDTNLDGGGSLPAPGGWRGLTTFATMDASVLEHVELRFAGASGFPTIQNLEPQLALRDVEVRAGDGTGYALGGLAPDSRGLCAAECAGFGFDLTGGTFDLARTTATACALGGYRAQAAFAGSVVDSIGWANGGPNAQGFDAGEWRFSNGDSAMAGTDGNLFVDPLFVAAPADLSLSPGSPCIDAGDPLSPPDTDGTRADMGCAQTDQCGGSTYCVGETNSQGCTPFIVASGGASTSSGAPFWIRAHDVINQQNGMFFYGRTGAASQPFFGGTLCVSGPFYRTPIQNSGGSTGGADCSGVLEFDFNARIQSGVDPNLVAGTRIWAQFWYRDPQGSFGSGTSNAIEFLICD